MQPVRANPKATDTEPEPEIHQAARAAKHGIVWLATTIAEILGDSIAADRKGRQERRKDERKGEGETGSDAAGDQGK